MPGPLALLGAAIVVPVLGLSTVLLVVIGGGAGAAPSPGCGPGGSGQQIAGATLDVEQLANAATITTTVAARGLPSYAALVALDTAYTESRLVNTAAETDHDSEGLFQQRISFYTAAVADDPVKATDAFLDRLTALPGWTALPAPVDAQAVQNSQYPDRYQSGLGVVTALKGQLWPAANATATPSATPVPSAFPSAFPAATPAAATGASQQTVCPGGGGAIPPGGTGNNVAGSTTLPAGLTLTGSTQGQAAVAFALAQLGKPYVYGAAGPAAWDCSGLTMGAWAAAGVALPHYTVTQAADGTPEPTDLSTAVSGDLVLIPGSDGTAAAPGHVGMVIGTATVDGATHLFLVQAPMTGIPVEITDATEWAGQIVAVRHIA